LFLFVFMFLLLTARWSSQRRRKVRLGSSVMFQNYAVINKYKNING
jgi:hypothetical protein